MLCYVLGYDELFVFVVGVLVMLVVDMVLEFDDVLIFYMLGMIGKVKGVLFDYYCVMWVGFICVLMCGM